MRRRRKKHRGRNKKTTAKENLREGRERRKPESIMKPIVHSCKRKELSKALKISEK